MTAYYNENDPAAAAGLRELIKDGQIADGVVDERSIVEVRGRDLAGFSQHHFFAGCGGWSYGLRLSGWPDRKPVWTGSCPCPPFSVAGAKKACTECGSRTLLPHPYETGIFVCCECGFEWFGDARHLWPEFYRLIRECQPSAIFGEQVAGHDGEIWLSGVRATLEILGYGVGAANLGAHSVGAFHKRQRLFWGATKVGESALLADSVAGGLPGRAQGARREAGSGKWVSNRVAAGIVEESHRARSKEQRRRLLESEGFTASSGVATELGDTCGQGLSLREFDELSAEERVEKWRAALQSGEALSSLGDAACDVERRDGESCAGDDAQGKNRGYGFSGWENPHWIECLDGKFRPVESGIFPLVDGVSKGVVRSRDPGLSFDADQTAEARVNRLRWYGNAIVPECAAAFVSAFGECV